MVLERADAENTEDIERASGLCAEWKNGRRTYTRVGNTQLQVVRSGRSLKITTAGLDHFDIYADGHPAGPGFPLKGNGTVRVPLPKGADAVEVVGFSQKVIRQRRPFFSKTVCTAGVASTRRLIPSPSII